MRTLLWPGQAAVAGLGLVVALLAALLLATAWLALARPVRRDAVRGPAPIREFQVYATVAPVAVESHDVILNADSPSAAWPDMRIDLNRAGVSELSVLPGVGPGLAKRIVAHRDGHGPFHSIDSLGEVGGIGPRTIAGLREYAVAERDDDVGPGR